MLPWNDHVKPEEVSWLQHSTNLLFPPACDGLTFKCFNELRLLSLSIFNLVPPVMYMRNPPPKKNGPLCLPSLIKEPRPGEQKKQAGWTRFAGRIEDESWVGWEKKSLERLKTKSANRFSLPGIAYHFQRSNYHIPTTLFGSDWSSLKSVEHTCIDQIGRWLHQLQRVLRAGSGSPSPGMPAPRLQQLSPPCWSSAWSLRSKGSASLQSHLKGTKHISGRLKMNLRSSEIEAWWVPKSGEKTSVEEKVVYPILYKGFSTRWLALRFLNHQQYVAHRFFLLRQEAGAEQLLEIGKKFLLPILAGKTHLKNLNTCTNFPRNLQQDPLNGPLNLSI